MNYINIGKYVNTHGIKGEIRILSNFSRKDLIFIPNNTIYIGEKKLEYKIKSYRVHKNYDMLTLYGINNINEIEYLKNNNVYVNKDNIDTEYIVEDFMDYKVIVDDIEYKVIDVIENKKNKILVLENRTMIPLVDEFVIRIDSADKKIYIRNMEGLVL